MICGSVSTIQVQPARSQETPPTPDQTERIYLPTLASNYSQPPLIQGIDWPQIGHDSQRTNYTSEQVDPPYCYSWKWYEVPLASRMQPVVSDGRLFIGGMDGKLYAINASTGAPLWNFLTSGPIRQSAAVMQDKVFFSSHDGYTYALGVVSGKFLWKTFTGSSSTAPLLDYNRDWVYVASSNGILTALNSANGSQVWVYDFGAPILTTPALSENNQTIFLGNEDIYAVAINATDGKELWKTRLQGQSLADRYPVVSGNSVIYRSQPLYNFHILLHEGDSVMDRAGGLLSDWTADWANVKPQIINYLNQKSAKQTMFVLSTNTGTSLGILPVLYTYGNNDIPNVPVIQGDNTFITYRARHGIQTDNNTIHVTTEYDAELGKLDLNTLDISALTASEGLGYPLPFRMTSDEPAMLTMGGNILYIDNWERLGGINVSNGDLIHVGAVSNDWPECYPSQCGPGTDNPFFPLTGSGAAYPFPSPRVTEGHQRSGAVIANGMIYWRVIAGGLAGISHRSGGACPTPQVWTLNTTTSSPNSNENMPDDPAATTRSLDEYVTLDLTTPKSNPDPALVERLRKEISGIISSGNHMMPFVLERGFSEPYLWPYNIANTCSSAPCLPIISYNTGITSGNVYWHDPGELLYSMALAYPYLDSQLQAQVKVYMSQEMANLPPLRNLPWSGNPNPLPAWLTLGTAREGYEVPYRSQLNIWPPPAANMSALYSLWLWSKNTGDWSYVESHWADAQALFNARKDNMNYYADISGAIGYARMADHLGKTSDFSDGLGAAVAAMQAGLNFDSYRQRAENEYLDPREIATGWYAPTLYGITPEVGLYLREQFNGIVVSYLASKEVGDGLRWWYLTRAGAHAEEGETSYVAPIAAWSHFLGHAFVNGDSQSTLKQWLDRPWGLGDLFSIQKITATIQANP